MNLLDKLKNLGSDSHSSGVSQDWYITAEGARGITDEDTITKSDAYLKIDFGGKEVKTRPVKNNRSPNWNETFHFKLNSEQAKNMQLKLMDQDIGFDDSLGTATISRGDLPMVSGEEKSLKIPVFRGEQITAMIHLRVKLITEGQFHGQQPYQSSNVHSTNYPQQQFQQPYNQTQPMMPQQQFQQQPYNQFQQQPYTQSQQPYTQSQQPYTQSQQPYTQQSYSQQPSNKGQQSSMHQPHSYYGRQ